MSACFGAVFSTFYPSIYVVLKRIVPQKEISRYSHLFELSIQIASAISILLSGFLYELLGFFVLTTIGSVALIISGYMISKLTFEKKRETERGRKENFSGIYIFNYL